MEFLFFPLPLLSPEWFPLVAAGKWVRGGGAPRLGKLAPGRQVGTGPGPYSGTVPAIRSHCAAVTALTTRTAATAAPTIAASAASSIHPSV